MLRTTTILALAAALTSSVAVASDFPARLGDADHARSVAAEANIDWLDAEDLSQEDLLRVRDDARYVFITIKDVIFQCDTQEGGCVPVVAMRES